MNTGENVIFSLPIIDAALGLANIRSVICLGNTWTARRYPMTLHRHWPEVEKMLVTVDSFATPRSQWHTDPDFRRRMLLRMGQDRALQGEGLYRGVAGQMRRGRRSIRSNSKSSSVALNMPASVRNAGTPADRWAAPPAPAVPRSARGRGQTAKVVDGVSAMSRRAAAATKVCERQCGGSVSQR